MVIVGFSCITFTILSNSFAASARMLYKIANAKHLTQKEETKLMQNLVNDLNNTKQTNLISTNLLNENYEKWLTAKRKPVYELYK